MTRAEVVLQAMISPDVAKWVRDRAEREGQSVSAWLRNLVERERAQLHVAAWWWEKSRFGDSTRSFLAGPPMPHFILERLPAPGESESVEFRVLHHKTQRRITIDALTHTYVTIGETLYEGAFLLRGDPRLWRVKNSFADESDKESWRVVLEHFSPGQRA